MSGVKGIGGPTGQPPDVGDVAESGRTTGARFADALERARSSGANTAAPDAVPNAAPSASFASIAERVQRGTLSPMDAVDALVQTATERSGAIPALRADVAARLREFILNDPLIRQYLSEAGVKLPK